MSMDPAVMAQMLTQGLGGGSYGGGAAGPSMQGQVSPMNAAAQLTQKLMLMRALSAPQRQQQQANGMLPTTNAQIAADPTMQALQQAQMQQVVMPQPQVAPPNSQPTPGYS